MLNKVLQKLKINLEPAGDSIVGTWISPDGHYAFAEFRTPDEATRALGILSKSNVKLLS